MCTYPAILLHILLNPSYEMIKQKKTCSLAGQNLPSKKGKEKVARTFTRLGITNSSFVEC